MKQDFQTDAEQVSQKSAFRQVKTKRRECSEKTEGAKMAPVSVEYTFSLQAERSVTQANYNTYISPIFHPNRIMQEHDFLYMIEGEWEIALEEAGKCHCFQVRRGDLVILPEGLHHYGTVHCSPGTRNMYFHISSLPEDHMNAAPAGGRQSDPEGELSLSLVTHCGDDSRIPKLFAEIIGVYWGSSLYREKKLAQLYQLLWWEIREQQQKSPTASRYFSFAEKIAEFLQANPQKFFSVPEIAERFDVSVRTLNNRFHSVYGKSFYAWQMEQKLEMVYQFIRSNPDVTLKESARNFGFYDEFHFSRMFKKHFGIAPRYVR